MATRILVVDDDPGVRVLVKRILEEAGYDVSDVATVHEALAFRNHPWDLLVVDHVLPDGTGQEILQAMPSVPAVRVSGATENADLPKPFGAAKLLAVVHERLTRGTP